MTFTANTIALLVLVFVLGWLLGLASRSGGGKWRRRHDAEVAARAEDRRLHAAEVARLEERHRTRDGAVAGEPVTPSTLDLTRDRTADRDAEGRSLTR